MRTPILAIVATCALLGACNRADAPATSDAASGAASESGSYSPMPATESATGAGTGSVISAPDTGAASTGTAMPPDSGASNPGSAQMDAGASADVSITDSTESTGNKPATRKTEPNDRRPPGTNSPGTGTRP